MSCGETNLIDGGVLKNANVVQSSITNSDITASTVHASDLTSCRILKLAEIDEASAKTIADAIAQLSEAQLAMLANAILAQYKPLSNDPTLAQPPASTESPELSTHVIGDRAKLLGSPAAWLTIGGQKVPAYD